MWWNLPGGGVLEFENPEWELHLVRYEGRTLAWWEDASGRWLSLVRVGMA